MSDENKPATIADVLAMLADAGGGAGRMVRAVVLAPGVTVKVAAVSAFADAFVHRMYPTHNRAPEDLVLIYTRKQAALAALGMAAITGDAPAIVPTMTTDERARAEAWITEHAARLITGLTDPQLTALHAAACGTPETRQKQDADAAKN